MNKDQITKRFLKHNFHDARLKQIKVIPAEDRKSKSSVEVFLEDYDEGKLIQIIFEKPGNMTFTGDFDVLLDNVGFGNTSHTKASVDTTHLLKTIARQKAKWNIEYAEEMKSPIDQKVTNIEKYIAFKIFFFGGTLEILARNFKIIKTTKG